MSVGSFFDTYQNTLLNKQIINPLTRSKKTLAPPKLGIQSTNPAPVTVPGYGSALPEWLNTKSSGAVDRYMQSKSARTSEIAKQYADKASGQVSTNEFGIVQDKTTDFSDYFNKQLSAVSNIGKTALATEEAKAQWQSLQSMQDLNAGYTANIAPGASSDNAGARAVSMAVDAMKRGVPYVWGGNSLQKGIDCSGLVQQIYSSMGISLPRTSYEQAKSGKEISLGSLLPGDLVFYNTGKNDPNGIGRVSHVAIYMGNGKVISALNTKSGIKIQPLNNNGGAVRAVRPW